MILVCSKALGRAMALAAGMLLLSCGSEGSKVSKDVSTDAEVNIEVWLADAGIDSPVAPDVEPEADPLPDLPDEILDPCLEPGLLPLGCTCVGDTDCASGYCVQAEAGKVCTWACIEDCPEGWGCGLVSGSCPDCAYICVPLFAHLCQPCKAHSDCGDPSASSPNLCVMFGGGEEYCGGWCGAGESCPEGYECTDADSGGLTSPQCLPISGECECSDLAKAEGAATSCAIENEHGSCEGERVCAEEGLTECDAAVPEAETCNGEDDDCDGEVDEDLGSATCGLGICEHTVDNCVGGIPQACDPKEGVDLEKCDGQDNDCDGEVDEDSPDADGDGLANCVDEDDDGDGQPDETDSCPLEANAEQTDSDFDGQGDQCDLDDDNDQFPDEGDCLPLDKDSYPGAEEVCDGKDNDCDLWVDEATCDDKNPCTDDSCDPEAGCFFHTNTIPCNDGDPCTAGEVCQEGECVGGVNVCPCSTDDDCAALGFIGGCVGTLFCDISSLPYSCVVDPAGAAPCPAPQTQCQVVTCDVNTGACVEADLPAGAPCDDDSACTIYDQCIGGMCVAGAVATCEDANQCTSNSCDANLGCQFQPLSGVPCEDGTVCTVGDHCMNGECDTGDPLNCDDQNPCTDDSCDGATGCIHVNNEAGCDDGNACTVNDSCTVGWCVGTSYACSDGNPCTDDYCDAVDGCFTVSNNAAGTPSRRVFAAFDDGNPCTTADTCAAGTCGGGGDTNCNDDNSCTIDSCDQEWGCLHTANDSPCSDGDACTGPDQCKSSQCAPGPALDCQDGNPCTDDACEPAAGCVHAHNAAACDDNNLCTDGDYCADGLCLPGEPVPCDDGTPCTDDSCHPASGCLFHTNTVPCDDGNECTTGDVCADGACAGAAELPCDDGDPCTDDFCTPEAGCQAAPNQAACDDGLPCTDNDYCEGGVCLGGGPTDCDDQNPCTADSCEPAQGCVHDAEDGPCEDGDACTDDDFCEGGECLGGEPVDCDDADPCTDDLCTPDTGCYFEHNSAPCEDGDPCTFGDSCTDGDCLPGGAASCDDSDPCTSDSCVEGGGCTHVADLSLPSCTEWTNEVNVSCFTGYPPAMDENGVVWALATATDCNGGDAYNNDRIVGVHSLNGDQVAIFTVASPNSQPIYRGSRITMSTDWNWNSTCGGCQLAYSLPDGGKVWQGGQGPHPRGGISMNDEGTIFSAYGSILAINWSGSTAWNAPGNSGQGGGSAIMGDGGVVGCGSGGNCRKLTQSGSSQWQVYIGMGGGSLATDSAARIVAAGGEKGINVFTPAGTKVWSHDPGASVSSPLVTATDQVVVGTGEGNALLLASSDGAVEATIAVCPDATFSPWLLTADGWVYGTCNDSRAAGVALDGNGAWSMATPENPRWLTLASDGQLLIAVANKVHRLTRGDLELADTPWPTRDHDFQRTRNGAQ